MTARTCRECRHGTMRGVDPAIRWSGHFRCAITGGTDSMADACPRFAPGRARLFDKRGDEVRRCDVPWLR